MYAKIIIDQNKYFCKMAAVKNFMLKISHLEIFDIENYLLKIDYKNKEKLDTIAQLINYNFNDYLAKQKPYLTSQQIKELIQQGFYFGAHSKNHPEYQFIDLKEQILPNRR